MAMLTTELDNGMLNKILLVLYDKQVKKNWNISLLMMSNKFFE